MRISFDGDDDRALLATRLGQDADVTDHDLAASFEAWFENKPLPGGRRLSADDLEGLRTVTDWSELDERGPGNSDFQTGWLGSG